MSETAKSDEITPPTDALSRSLGLIRRVLMDSDNGRAVLEYAAKPEMCHSGGVVQGGFVTGWIDAAMAHAIIATVGDQAVPMSLELKVSFFQPTYPGTVTAEAWIERRGRQNCFMEGRLLDADGAILAKASSTLRLMDRSKVEKKAQDAIQSKAVTG